MRGADFKAVRRLALAGDSSSSEVASPRPNSACQLAKRSINLSINNNNATKAEFKSKNKSSQMYFVHCICCMRFPPSLQQTNKHRHPFTHTHTHTGASIIERKATFANNQNNHVHVQYK